MTPDFATPKVIVPPVAHSRVPARSAGKSLAFRTLAGGRLRMLLSSVALAAGAAAAWLPAVTLAQGFGSGIGYGRNFGSGIGKGANFGSSFGLGLTSPHATYGGYGNYGNYGGYGLGGYGSYGYGNYAPGLYGYGAGISAPGYNFGVSGVGYGGVGYGGVGYGGVGYGGVGYGGVGYGGGLGYGGGYSTSSLTITGPGLINGPGVSGYGASGDPGYGAAGYGATGYGGAGYSGAWGAGYSPDGVWRDPINNQILQSQYNQDWQRWSAQQAEDYVAGQQRGIVNPELTNPGDPTPISRVPFPSSPEAQQRTARFLAQGDEYFKQQQYSKALERYRSAASTTRDQAAAYLRVGVAYIALGRYDSAAEYLRRGVELAPSAAVIDISLDSLYGPDQQLAKTSHLHSVTAWVKEDYRSSNRLFLLGTLLVLDRSNQAKEVLDTAWRLGGDRAGIQSLLSAISGEALPNALSPSAPHSTPVDAATAAGPGPERTVNPGTVNPGTAEAPQTMQGSRGGLPAVAPAARTGAFAPDTDELGPSLGSPPPLQGRPTSGSADQSSPASPANNVAPPTTAEQASPEPWPPLPAPASRGASPGFEPLFPLPSSQK